MTEPLNLTDPLFSARFCLDDDKIWGYGFNDCIPLLSIY